MSSLKAISYPATRFANNFDAVHAFAATLHTTQIDTLVVNAGVQGYDVSARTEQGFERTFGVNLWHITCSHGSGCRR